MQTDVYQKLTDKIMADLETGELTWLKPWSAGNMEGRTIKPLRHNGLPYNGINILMLWGAAIEGEYLSPYWMTFKQAKELGAHVKKGERGNLVVYANTITKTVAALSLQRFWQMVALTRAPDIGKRGQDDIALSAVGVCRC